MVSRGQSALEYLLLIGGAVLISTIVLVIVLASQTGGNYFLGNQLAGYQSNTSQFFSGGGNPPTPPTPDMTPPTVSIFSSDWDDSQVTLTYQGLENVSNPITFTLLRANGIGSQSVLDAVQLSGATNSFDNPPSTSNITSIPLGAFTVLPSGTVAVIDDTGLTNGTRYFYRIRACDAAVPANCVAPPSIMEQPHVPNYVATFGTPEVVFDQTAASPPAIGELCNAGLDLADTQARAVKFNGQLFLASGNAPNFYMRTGTDFSDLRSVCSSPALPSGLSAQAYTYNSYEWLTSIYAQGGVMHGFVHNEYHDTTPPCDNFPTPGNKCWYNGLTYASSANGLTFTQSNPVSVISSSPIPWNAITMNASPHGPMEPGNIISRDESGTIYYYMHFRSLQGVGQYMPAGVCVMRTDDLSNPNSWRAWNAATQSFDLTMAKPYNALNQPTPTGVPHCSIISQSNIMDAVGTVTYNTFMKKYLMITSGVYGGNCGVFYSLSDDLINWSQARHIAGYNNPNQTNCVSGAPVIAYASYIDHDQLTDPTDPNFEKSDATGYMYFVQFNNGWGLDRDLVRRSITWAKT